MRIRNNDVTALRSTMNLYLLNKGQYFMETPKAWEIWGIYDGLEMRVQRIPKKSILFCFTDPSFLYGNDANPESMWKRDF